MIKRQSLCFLSRQIAAIAQPRAILINRVVMAFLNKDPFTACFHGFSQSGQLRARFPGKKVTVDVGSSLMTINANNGLSLKGCSDRSDGPHKKVDDGFLKPHALAPPYPQLVHDLDPRLEGKDVKLINGRGMCERGSPLGFLDHPMREKLVVAVDVDEVLGSFVSALNKFIADHYSLNHSVSEYHVYEFFKMTCSELLLTESIGSYPIQEMAIDWKIWIMVCAPIVCRDCNVVLYWTGKIWNCSRNEADIRVHEFFKTSYFKTGIHPIPGARVALHKLSTFCSLSVVTSRQNAIKDHTIDWIEKHYPGLFKEIHFGNHFALDGKSRPKSEICRSLGAHVLIDDNPRYAIECAEVGIKVLLFDYENSYPWCKMESATLHPLVTKVHNWDEVEQQIVSWIMF